MVIANCFIRERIVTLKEEEQLLRRRPHRARINAVAATHVLPLQLVVGSQATPTVDVPQLWHVQAVCLVRIRVQHRHPHRLEVVLEAALAIATVYV